MYEEEKHHCDMCCMRNFRCGSSPCIDRKQRKYLKENNQELIVVLSIFDTDEKGGDGGFNPNDTYANWQWYLVKTADKKSWEIINGGY